MATRATISNRSTLLQSKKNEVTPKAKMKGLIRKVIDTSSWLAPMLREFRKPQNERAEPEWLTLEEKMCLLQHEEERSLEAIESITDKLEILVAFMDYERDTVKKMVQVGRFVAFSGGRKLVEKGGEPHGAYLVLSGEVSLESGQPLPLAYSVMGRLRRVGRLRGKDPPRIRDALSFKGREEVFGDLEIVYGRKRPATVIPVGVVEFICFEKKDLLEILGPKIEAWQSVKKHLKSYRLFNFLNEDTLNEVVKFGQYKYFQPQQYIKIPVLEKSVPGDCYFLIEGCCEVLQRLLIARNDKLVGTERFKLYYWQDQKIFPDWVEPVYMRACQLHAGAFFGFGERLCRQHIMTVTNCKFLTLPFQLVDLIKDKLPAYQESMELLDDVFPSTIELLLSYAKGRFWKDYVRKTIRNSKKRGSNDNTIHDVPLTWRADRLKFLDPDRKERIQGHPDFRPGEDLLRLVKEVTEGRKRREELAVRRRHVFAQYSTGEQ